MNDSPVVSVCIVTYNQEKYIAECLQSIVDQKTDFPFEIIIGDDCSTDATRAIIDSFANQYPQLIKKVFYENNIGASANYNYIHSITQGRFIAHCDGDDLFLPGKLQAQYDFLIAFPDYSVCWHKVQFFDDNGNTADEYVKPGISPPGETITLDYVLRTGTVATHSSIMYRKSAKRTYNPSYETMDLYFTLEFLMSGKGIILQDVLGKYRINPSSYSRVSKSKAKMRTLVIDHWMYFLPFVPEHKSRMFIFAFINFLVDLKNRRRTALNFFVMMCKTISFFRIAELYDSLKNMKYLRLPQPGK